MNVRFPGKLATKVLVPTFSSALYVVDCGIVRVVTAVFVALAKATLRELMLLADTDVGAYTFGTLNIR